ncbi:hypothetical protein EDD16DRAFT_1708989 [Pisolithus croceorrhizus]|nr:hypothetical protein EDD16DRAFT_1708989 [Pisolithus croceorrhizus]KAI6161767.1 hypothetical protein EDD17DRAFT_1758669 [Pisolithus thermaeus]
MVWVAFSIIIILINSPPSTSQSSSSQQPSCGDKQTTQKQNRATRVKASVGPSQVPSLQKSAGGEAKWEEPDLLDIPKPHTLFDSAWRKAEKSMQRVQAGQVDPGYHFLKLTLFVNVSTPEWKKTYLFNWVSAHPLWISQIGVHSPSKFPSPQMWRDFLNGIDTDQPSSMRSASMKLAVWDILGENIIHAVQGFTGASEEIEWKGMQDPITMPSSSSQLPDGVPPSPSSPSDDELSLSISAPPLPLLSSASTSQLPYDQALPSGPSYPAHPLFVPPLELITAVLQVQKPLDEIT